MPVDDKERRHRNNHDKLTMVCTRHIDLMLSSASVGLRRIGVFRDNAAMEPFTFTTWLHATVALCNDSQRRNSPLYILATPSQCTLGSCGLALDPQLLSVTHGMASGEQLDGHAMKLPVGAANKHRRRSYQCGFLHRRLTSHCSCVCYLSETAHELCDVMMLQGHIALEPRMR